MHAASIRHLLTPGTPGYAALKLGAVGGAAALQVYFRRRARQEEHVEEQRELPVAEPRMPHPRSKKKRRRRH